MDGDGLTDRAVVWGDPAPPIGDGRSRPWHLTVVTGGRTYETTIEHAFPEASMRGIIDVNGDGHGLALVQVDQGASTQFWRAFTLASGALRQVETAGGLPLTISMYGSGGRSGSFSCVQDPSATRLLSLVSVSARPTLDVLDWSAQTYRIRAAQAVLVGEVHGTTSRTELQDPGSEFNRKTWPVGSAFRVGPCFVPFAY